MLRKIRRGLAVVFFVAVTLLFLDFTGTLHAWLGWTARVQFLPALLALNLGVVVFLVLLTLVLGRVYCSVICPLGVMQDLFAHAGRKRKKNRYTYSPAKTWLRWGVLAVFVLALVAGVGSLAALLAPYSSYGRMASNLLAPLYAWGNNLLAYAAERADSYAFYETEVWMKSMPTFLIALFSFYYNRRAGVAGRAHLLQHHLSCRHGAGLSGALFVAEAGGRRRPLRGLQAVRAQLQGLVHRHRPSSDRLQPLRGLHELHRDLPQGRHQL